MKNFLLKSIMVLTVMAMFITTGCGSKSDPGEEIKKALTPVITPNGGTFTNSTSVTMSTETANGIIRYTLDGTTPSETSAYYNTAITIDKTTTIKAKTFKDGMYSSDAATAVITIQNSTTEDATLQTISVKTMPTKVIYLIGETLDITGLVIEGTYSDGSKKTETVAISNITGFNSSTAGAKTLTVTISGKTATFNVTVNNAVIKAEFTLIRKIDIMGINEYSAQFEVSDSRIAKLIFEGSTDINPKEVTISNKSGAIASFMIAETVTSITVKAVDSSGNQLGDTKTVTFSN